MRRAWLAAPLLVSLFLGLPAPEAIADDVTPVGSSTAGQPVLLASTTIGWIEGESRWLSLPWVALEGVQNLQVVATSSAPGVEILYDHESLTHAELTNGPELGANEIDVTRFKVATSTATPEQWQIGLVATWDYRGRTFEGSSTLDVTTISATNEHALQPLTTTATVASTGDGATNWVTLRYLGLAEETRGVEITVEGNLPVQYPDELFTSLHHDPVLVHGESESAQIWFDPERLDPGIYELTVRIAYRTDANTVVRHASHPLTITVE